MKLHLTLNGRWVDAIDIDPKKRFDAEYLENKKMLLQFQNQTKMKNEKLAEEFYLDPLPAEGIRLGVR